MTKYKVEIDGESRMLIIDHPDKTVTLKKLYEIKNILEKSTGKSYIYGMVHRKPCYWFSYKLEDNSVIVCGTMSKKECINETKKNIKQK